MSWFVTGLERAGFAQLFIWAFAGAYDDEEAAARAHDLAALKYWGPGTVLNFPVLPSIQNPVPFQE